MRETLKEGGGLLLTDIALAAVLEPKDGARDGLPTSVPPKHPSVLGHVLRLTIAAVRGDHLYVLVVELLIERKFSG